MRLFRFVMSVVSVVSATSLIACAADDESDVAEAGARQTRGGEGSPQATSQSEPTKEQIDKSLEVTRKAVEQFKFRGYDVVACLGDDNQLVAGGASFWHTPLEIFFMDKNKPLAAKRVSPREESVAQVFERKSTSDPFDTLELRLAEWSQSPDDSLMYVHSKASLVIKKKSKADRTVPLKCYYAMSGLE